MSPFEQAEEAIGRAIDLYMQGLLGEDTVRQLIEQWDQRVQQSERGRHLGIITRDSREGFLAARGGADSGRPINRVAKATEGTFEQMKGLREDLHRNGTGGFVGDVDVKVHSVVA